MMREATEQERQGVNECIRSISQKVYTQEEVTNMLNKIAHEVSEKMYYMKSCPNERNIIVGVITGHRETYESLCPTCKNTDCVINKSLIPGEDVVNMLTEILNVCLELKEDKTSYIHIDDMIQMIQEEVNKLKGDTDGKA